MAKTQSEPPNLFASAPFAFADRFLQDHAGQIISEPRTAVLELIANSYDAGATQIDIIWPTEKDEKFSVTDNGIGMTKAEFEKRWKTLCYDREAEQGTSVVFPKGVNGKRKAFGRSGKGRHAPFCFADSYEIVTTKDGERIHMRVGLASSGTTPFEITLLSGPKKQEGHGTEVSAVLEKHLLDVDELRQLIGSKFIVDPSLCIKVNEKPVQLMSLEGLKTTEILVENCGTITIHFIDSIEHSRSARLRGITWWVNQRRVGEPNSRGQHLA